MLDHEIPHTTFRADALSDDLAGHLCGRTVDMVLTDVPHGIRSAWAEESAAPGFARRGRRLAQRTDGGLRRIRQVPPLHRGQAAGGVLSVIRGMLIDQEEHNDLP
jgi:hypothetical protein